MIKKLYGKRTNWSMTEMVNQMLEAEMAKDEMGEDEVDMNHFYSGVLNNQSYLLKM